VRVALISMAGQPRAAAHGAPLALAGKSLARRQLEFALAAGCEGMIVLGDGGSAEAIALRHAAEGAGARFQAIRDSHGLLGTVRADDELLALAPGLLPEAKEAREALGKKGVLVLPAGAGVAAGFERIDLERAWAGALVVGGAQVEQLAGLPADSEPASALVRIALQARLPEQRLPAEALTDGSWAMVAEGSDLAASERAWLARHLPPLRGWSVSSWLAQRALRPLASRLLPAARSAEALGGSAIALLVGAVLLAAYGLVPLAFALVALGAVLAQATRGLTLLCRAPFGGPVRWTSLAGILPCLVDAALVACAVFAIDGAWPHRLFPPLVFFGSMLALRSTFEWAALARDRGFIALVLAFATAFGAGEWAIMALALGLIALNLVKSGALRG